MRPLLIVGDAPNLSNGLGRIARDIATVLHSERDELGVEVSQLGWGYDGSPWPWRCYPLHDTREWGKGDILQTLDWCKQTAALNPALGAGKPIVLMVWDPARCYPIANQLARSPERKKLELWGYFPIDSSNAEGKIGGPAQVAVEEFDRVLGYGRFGAGVLQRMLGKSEPGPWLPHGLEEVWTQGGRRSVRYDSQVQSWLNGNREGDLLVGVVAANQPRKDYGLVFAAASRMRELWKGGAVRLWLHVDRPVTQSDLGWAIPELAEVYGWNDPKKLLVSTSAAQLPDELLADLYARCHVTLAPGLGEGFGYPIAESLACGTPVIQGDWAGGPEIASVARWVLPPVAWRVEGPYALRRPVHDPDVWAARALEAAEWKLREPEACAAYCRGQVDHLRWMNLRRRWLDLLGGWIKGERD